MAYHFVLQHGGHSCVHLVGRNTRHGPFLAQSTIIYRIIHRGKYGSSDNGMDG